MYKSDTVEDEYFATPKQPKIERVLQYSIQNKGTKTFVYLGRPVAPTESFNRDYTGTFFDLDLSKLKFSGANDTENHAHILYDVLNEIPVNQSTNCNG